MSTVHGYILIFTYIFRIQTVGIDIWEKYDIGGRGKPLLQGPGGPENNQNLAHSFSILSSIQQA